VPINRSSIKSKYNSMVKAGELLDSGRSVVIFPEGGIVSKHFPNMVPFKDGAFKLAIEKQIPIVPVSIPWNWIILPDDGNYVLRCRKNMLIFHPPISTKGMSPDDLNQLKQKTFDTINSELKKWN
jgi:1-acyl-sn-glycerol-3-phosphate acyltransferase